MSWIVEMCSVCHQTIKNHYELRGHVDICGHGRYKMCGRCFGTGRIEAEQPGHEPYVIDCLECDGIGKVKDAEGS